MPGAQTTAVMGAVTTKTSSPHSYAPNDQSSTKQHLPRDESDRDPTFRRFRDRLLIAAERGDVDALLARMTPTLRVPETTIVASRLLEQQGVQPGRPWESLVRALRLGAVATSPTEYVAPYLVESRVEGVVTVGHRVRLRSSPSPTAPILRTLDYHEVDVLIDHFYDTRATSLEVPESWVHVRTPTGETGYVSVGLLYWPGSERFYFERLASGWKLVAFGKGD